MRQFLCAVTLVLLGGCAQDIAAFDGRRAERVYAFEDPALDRVTEDRLRTFESEGAFVSYIQQVERTRRARRPLWTAGRQIRFAMQDAPVPCPPEQPDCLVLQDSASDIVVSASRAAAPNVTNVQTMGVDEGDVIKQIGDFLLVLQDGRIFSVDTRGGLRLADRINVYRDADVGTWYDEMLVQGDRVLITAYSYEEGATELSVFTLDRASGKLRADGVFLISSDDYYSVDNYAGRIIGDKLILYTPYELDDLEEMSDRPVIRRWLPEGEREKAKLRGTPLLDPRNIYRPVQRTAAPTVHGLTICPLGKWQPGRDLNCETTGFMGPEAAEMFVSPDDIFLWVYPSYEDLGWGDDSDDAKCEAAGRAARKDVAPAAIFRLQIGSREAGVVGVSGTPFDQFSMDSQKGAFRALADWHDFHCDGWSERSRDVSFLSIGHQDFGESFYAIPDRDIIALPSPGARNVENRFADDWLVYGGRKGWSRRPPGKADGVQTSRVVAVPVRRPERAVTIDLPHNIIRLERVGADGMIVNGYRDDSGLSLSLLELSGVPAVTSRAHLPDRYESEGRSHAFNSLVEADGSGIMGVPTVRRADDADGWWWRSESSSLSYLTLSRAGQVADAGELKVGNQGADPAYACEVSCIDWYGNTRPIFTGGRIFGLLGTEMVEAALVGGRVLERRRIDLTAPAR